MSEALGWRYSLSDSPLRARGFCAFAVVGTAAAAVMVILWPDLVNLLVGVEVMNACLLPIVLGFLLALERRALPNDLRMSGTSGRPTPRSANRTAHTPPGAEPRPQDGHPRTAGITAVAGG
jgi:hypothetical protein